MTRDPELRAWRFLPALGLAVAIFLLSDQTRLPPSPIAFVGVDKVIHAGVYALLCGLLLWAARPTSVIAAFGWAVLVALYGASDEWHQSFVPGREADPLDLVADAMGALLLAGLYCRRRAALTAGQKSGSG